MQTGYGADSVRSRDLRINCLHPRVGRVERSAECSAVAVAGVEQYVNKDDDYKSKLRLVQISLS